MPMVPVALDVERQAKAKRFAAAKRQIALAELVVTMGYLVVVVWSRAAIALRDGLVATFGQDNRVLVIGGYFLAVWLGYTVITFGLSFVGGFLLPHRYGLSVQTLLQWLADWAKSEVLAVLFGVLAMEVIVAVILWTPTWWWLVAGILYLAFVVVLSNLGPILLVPLFFKLTPLTDSGLAAYLEAMARRAETHVQGVYRMNLSAKTTAANAALMGLGRTRRVVLGDTLLDRFTTNEIGVVFAHELGHHVHRDVPRLIITQSLVTLASLYIASVVVHRGIVAFGYQGMADIAVIPLLALVLGTLTLLAAPLLNGLSRRMERQADWYALVTTNDPAAFTSAMTRLANQNLAEYSPPGWVEKLLYDHPSIRQRLLMAEAYSVQSRSV